MTIPTSPSTPVEQNRKKWRLLISEYDRSDLSQTRFCKKNDLNIHQFRYYRRVLAPKQAKMLPIEVFSNLRSSQSAEPLTLYLSAEVKLIIPLPCGPQQLQHIFSAVQGMSC